MAGSCAIANQTVLPLRCSMCTSGACGVHAFIVCNNAVILPAAAAPRAITPATSRCTRNALPAQQLTHVHACRTCHCCLNVVALAAAVCAFNRRTATGQGTIAASSQLVSSSLPRLACYSSSHHACCSNAGCSSNPGPNLNPNATWSCQLPAAHGVKCTAGCSGPSAAPDPPVAVCDFGEHATCVGCRAAAASSVIAAQQSVHSQLLHLLLAVDDAHTCFAAAGGACPALLPSANGSGSIDLQQLFICCAQTVLSSAWDHMGLSCINSSK